MKTDFWNYGVTSITLTLKTVFSSLFYKQDHIIYKFLFRKLNLVCWWHESYILYISKIKDISWSIWDKYDPTRMWFVDWWPYSFINRKKMFVILVRVMPTKQLQYFSKYCSIKSVHTNYEKVNFHVENWLLKAES